MNDQDPPKNSLDVSSHLTADASLAWANVGLRRQEKYTKLDVTHALIS